MTWVGLVEIATHKNPIIGDWEKYAPKISAGGVVFGVMCLALAISISVKHSKDE
jgi:hypothetical protein